VTRKSDPPSDDDDRVATVITRYDRGAITLGTAARLAGVDRWTMRERLREHGVDLRLGLADDADTQREIQAAGELTFDDADSRTSNSE
jgi:predicted HTH domain antitoxin